MTNYKIKKPILTVYMPVFNAAPYLPQAIESILSQTYTNFEFIIVDDASTDSSWKIIQKYARLDRRLRIFRNKVNLGVSDTSNLAIFSARGKYLARIDADDIAFPNRLQKQINFLQKNKKTIAVGGQCVVIDAEDKIIGYKKFPTNPQQLSRMISWAIPIQQPALLVNRTLLPNNFTWYDHQKTSAEEVNLIFKFLKIGQIANLPDYVLYYRQLPNSLSHINPKKTFYFTLQSRLLAWKNGFEPSLSAILLNLIQLIVITALPTPIINNLWNFIRGITSHDTQYQIGTFAPVKV
jgi:glycosyltransferase involved in cell wall biosynthesis